MAKTRDINWINFVRSLVIALALLGAWGTWAFLDGIFNQVVADDEDPIPDPVTLPDPCDPNIPARQLWGFDDQRGNYNYITPQKIKKALELAKEGKIIRLDHLLEPGRNGVIGNFTVQTFRDTPPAVPPTPPTMFTITTYELAMQPIEIPTGFADQHNALGQQGAQIDAWNHMGHGNGKAYNCFDLLDDNNLFVEPDIRNLSGTMFAGYKGFGVDKLDSIITRGVLIDVAAFKKAQMAAQGQDVANFPPPGLIYTSEDLEDALHSQDLEIDDIEPGDVILVRTGNAAKFWTEDPENVQNNRSATDGYFGPGQAQIDDRAGQWIVNRKAFAYASDTRGGPHRMLMSNGVTLIENLDPELLAKDGHERFEDYTNGKKAYIFLFVA